MVGFGLEVASRQSFLASDAAGLYGRNSRLVKYGAILVTAIDGGNKKRTKGC